MLSDVIRQFCVKHSIRPSGIVAAVSGGTDSTALLLALDPLRADGFAIHAAHVNHHLRGAESDADQLFVCRLCERLNIPLVIADGTLDDGAVRDRGIEAAAREIRYARLGEIREQTGSRWVATAHQKNDQAETVLMRLIAGGGLGSLRGIRPVREDGFVRPLLDTGRDAIEAYLRVRGVTARSDTSNDDPRFLRNRVRVALREFDAVDALAGIAAQTQLAWPLLETSIDEAEAAFVTTTRDEARFRGWPDHPWLRQALLQRHILRLDPHARDVSSRDLERLADQVGTTPRVSVTRDLELVTREGMTILRRIPQRTPSFDLPLTEDGPAVLPHLAKTIRLTRIHELPAGRAFGGQGVQLLEMPDDRGIFRVRSRREGDRFHPLGLAAPKKLKELLIDRKIAAEERDRIPLLLWNDEIAWVAGVEVSERFKVTGGDGVLYEVRMEDAG